MTVIDLKSIIIAIVVLILFAVGSYFLGRSNGSEKVTIIQGDTVTVTKIDTISVELTKLKPIYYRVSDTVFYTRIQELDSLQRAILDEYKTTVTDSTIDYGIFVASVDTVLPDNLGRAQIKHFSRIPFDPQGYFETQFDFNIKTVEKTVYIPKERGFWETYFHFGIIGGFGYGFGSQRADAFIGIGAMLGI